MKRVNIYFKKKKKKKKTKKKKKKIGETKQNGKEGYGVKNNFKKREVGVRCRKGLF